MLLDWIHNYEYKEYVSLSRKPLRPISNSSFDNALFNCTYVPYVIFSFSTCVCFEQKEDTHIQFDDIIVEVNDLQMVFKVH